jgi:8-oxo-dGTP pyrophosphatase MutT (NUDIX family)
LIERAQGGPHAGQIALPGGKNEPGESLWQTALREAAEEINAPEQHVQLIGKLTELFIPVSRFLVYPFIGSASGSLSLKPLTSEVKRIIELDLFDFIHNHDREIALFHTAAGHVRKAPCFIYQDLKIWGATAMILNEFLEVLGSIQKVYST